MNEPVQNEANESQSSLLKSGPVNFEINASGNYSTSNQEKTEARLQQLKDALRAKFK